jgi:hypothetical protein
MLSAFGDRRVAISRELTKIHEETLRFSLSEALAYFEQVPPRGVFVIHPAAQPVNPPGPPPPPRGRGPPRGATTRPAPARRRPGRPAENAGKERRGHTGRSAGERNPAPERRPLAQRCRPEERR